MGAFHSTLFLSIGSRLAPQHNCVDCNSSAPLYIQQPSLPSTHRHCQLSKHKWESTLHRGAARGIEMAQKKSSSGNFKAPEAECKEGRVLRKGSSNFLTFIRLFGTAEVINSQNDLFNSGESMERVRFDGSFLNFSISETFRRSHNSSPPSFFSSSLFFLSLSSSSSCRQLASWKEGKIILNSD